MMYHCNLMAINENGQRYVQATDSSVGDFETMQDAFDAADAIIANAGGKSHDGVVAWVFAYDETKYANAWEAYDNDDYEDCEL